MTDSKSFPLRLPRSLKEAAEKMAKDDGTSMNQFVVMAVAEKVGTLKTASFFAERKNRADLDAFDRILNRDGGEAPRAEDRFGLE